MKKLPRPNFGMRLLSSLLCIILFLSMLAGILIADIRITTTKENTSKIIRESLFISHTVRPAPIHGGGSSGHGATLRSQTKLSSVKLAEEETAGVMTEALVEFIYNGMTEQYGELPITLDDVEEFIEESTLQDTVSDLSASLINDFITGENTTVIDEEMITDLVMENADLIESYFGVTVDEAAVSQMASSVVENEVVAQLQEEGIANVLMNNIAGTGSSSGSGNASDSDNSSGGSSSGATGSQEDAGQADGEDGTGDEMIPSDTTGNLELLAQLNQILEDMRTAISVTTMLICFGVAAVCIALLCVLNRKWIWYALRKIGVTLIFAALPLLIPTAMVLAAPETWSSLFASIAVAGTVTGMILTMTAPVCLGTAGAGIALIIASFVLKAAAKKRLASAETASTGAQVVVDVPAPEAIPEETAEAETPAEAAPAAEEAETPAEAAPSAEKTEDPAAEEAPVE